MANSRTEFKNIIDEFRSLLKISMRNPAKSQKKSTEWIMAEMKRIKSHTVPVMSPGKIYMFGYDAKHKKTLPYWDKFPLVICLAVSPKYLMGLNLHYIPPKARAVFLEKLLKYLSTKNISNNSRLKVNWSKVKGLPGARHMIKLYLASNVRYGLSEVAPKDWHNVIFLQTQKFVSDGKSISAVRAYNDARKRG